MDIKQFIQDNRGQAISADFIIVGLILIVLMFGCIDYWVTEANLQQAEHIKNYYLDRSRITGGLSSEDRINMTSSLDKCGFTVSSISAPDEGSVKRDLDNLGIIPEVWLNVHIKFKNQPFLIGSFLGVNNDKTIKLTGRSFTEYVGP